MHGLRQSDEPNIMNEAAIVDSPGDSAQFTSRHSIIVMRTINECIKKCTSTSTPNWTLATQYVKIFHKFALHATYRKPQTEISRVKRTNPIPAECFFGTF